MCLAHLHITPQDFWASTPIEVHYALKSHSDYATGIERSHWERLRMGAYFNYLINSSSKRRITYTTFKKDYFPLPFDEARAPINVPDEDTFGDMISFLQGMKEKTVSTNKL